MKGESISAVIVEDEPLATQTIKDFLHGEDWLKVIGEAADGERAVTLIDDLRPDLVFLIRKKSMCSRKSEIHRMIPVLSPRK